MNIESIRTRGDYQTRFESATLGIIDCASKFRKSCLSIHPRVALKLPKY